MAKPLAPAEDVGGYLHELLDSLKDDPQNSEVSPTISAADYVQRLVSELDSSKSNADVCAAAVPTSETEQSEFTLSQPSEFKVQSGTVSDSLDSNFDSANEETGEYHVEENDFREANQFGDEDVIVADEHFVAEYGEDNAEMEAESTSDVDQTIDSAYSQPSVELNNAEPREPELSESDTVGCESDTQPYTIIPATPHSEESSDTDTVRSETTDTSVVRYRENIELIPRPTGNPSTIAQLREVANLTVYDALSSYRRKQLISNAYVAFGGACVFMIMSLVTAMFGIEQAGVARTLSWIGIGIGSAASLLFLFFVTSVSRISGKSMKNQPSAAR